MKAHLKRFASKINGWNLFVGIVLGFALGVVLMNALIPNANQLIKAYHLDSKSIMEDRASRTGIQAVTPDIRFSK